MDVNDSLYELVDQKIEDSNEDSNVVLIFVLCIYIPLDIVIIAGNTFVLIVIRRTPSLHNIQFELLARLAFVDLLSGIVGFPLSIWGNITRQSLYLVVEDCELQYIPGKILHATSFLHLIVITVDRYIAVMKPLIYPKLVTRKSMRKWVAVSWVCGTMFGLLYLFPRIERREEKYFCFKTSKMFGSIALLLAVIPGTTMMVFMYVSIFKEAKKQQRKILNASSNRGEFKGTFKGAKTAFIVVAFFLMYYMPNVIRMLLDKIVEREKLFWMEWMAEMCIASSMAINPFIYVCRYKCFARSFRKIFKLNFQLG